MLRSALAYAEQFRFAVFPCHWITPSGSCSCGKTDCASPGKHPLTKNGFKDATKDSVRIRAWWQRWPEANIGIATGAVSGIAVLDIDPRHGGDEALASLQANYGPLPETPIVLTGGGGTHFYFRYPGMLVSNSSSEVGPGIDVRGDGGYVIAPRSMHASGNCYLWEVSSRIDKLPIAALPAWLLGLMTKARAEPFRDFHANGKNAPVPNLTGLVAGSPEGDRDNQLFRLACHLRRLGYNRAQAQPVLLDAAARCKPPFPAAEALRKWRWQ